MKIIIRCRITRPPLTSDFIEGLDMDPPLPPSELGEPSGCPMSLVPPPFPGAPELLLGWSLPLCFFEA